MSKSMEPSFAVNAPGKVSPAGPIPKKDQGHTDDLSMKHVGIAVGVFAILVGFFGYGFYVQQSPVTAKQDEMRIAEGAAIPPSDASLGTSEASARAAIPSTIAAMTVKEEPVAFPTAIQSVHADIYFDFGKTRLRADAIETLQRQAQLLKKDGPWAVLIQGYTDRHGSIEYNKRLALRRGESVKQFFIELGIPAESMKVVSLGQDAVLCDDQTPTCTHLNRRVHLELVKLHAPSVAATVTPLSTASTKEEAVSDVSLTSVESGVGQNPDAEAAVGASQDEAAQSTTIPSSDSH